MMKLGPGTSFSDYKESNIVLGLSIFQCVNSITLEIFFLNLSAKGSQGMVPVDPV